MKTAWPQLLWGALLVALAANVIYLLWPEAPETIVVTPHPATLRSHAEPLPVLIEAPASLSTGEGEATYLLVNPPSKSDEKAAVIQKISSRTAAKKQSKPSLAGKINLNSASAEQLQLLPGIGPTMAQRIVAYRKQHGPFQTVEQLLDVPGIGPKKLKKLLPYCSL